MTGLPQPRSISSWAQRIAVAGATMAAVGAVVLAMIGVGAVAGGTPLASSPSLAASEPRLDEPSVPVRIQIPALSIDLPVVSSERNVRGNPRGYPLCDVAQYWTRYDLPGAPGTTWILAHAQPGMFLPLFTNAAGNGGSGLIGKVVSLQLKDGRLLRYRINRVKQHAYNQAIAKRDRPSEHKLILQTSEGPAGTIPKLQVAATLIAADRTREAPPKPQPRACSQPRPTRGSSRPKPTAKASAKTDTIAVTEEDEPVDLGRLAVGSGAVLLGATLVAVYLVRR